MNDAEVASVLSATKHNSNHNRNPNEHRLKADKSRNELFHPPRPSENSLNGRSAPDISANNDDTVSVKADSEAETIIQSGREELSPEKKRKYIQHKAEHNGAKRSRLEAIGTETLAGVDDFKARKRKRVDSENGEERPTDTRNLSRATSRIASPALILKRERTDDSIFAHSTRGHSLPRSEGGKVLKSVENAKRPERETGDSVSDEGFRAKHRNHHGLDAGRNGGREGRNRLSQSRHLSHDRSTSPVRSHKRIVSASSHPTGHVHKRRNAPPPIQTIRRQHSSEDRDSLSSARGSPLPTGRPRRIPSNDDSATSPVKQMAPIKRQRDQNGRTRLARACAAQEVDIAKSRLKSHPEELDVPDNAGNTPLQIASLEGCAEIVQSLLDAGCDIDTKNIDKDTPLIDAVENGHLDVVKILLKAGANPRAGNARGDKPFDLIPSDSENYDALRRVLSEAKAKGFDRRKSVDLGGHAKDAPRTFKAASPRDSPPVHGTRASPPTAASTTGTSGTANRRRTVRSEVTRNDLLWTKPTSENLRNFAAKGDMAGVANILNVLPKADTESLIAAAKGSHDEVLGLLLGMGGPDPDPEPIRSGNHKPGYNTPMLAAIGGGNNSVIKLLLGQKGFDPTRLDYRGRTYYEISEERKGENWETERTLLKDAYNAYRAANHGKSESKVSRKSRDAKRSTAESVSPASSNRKTARSPSSRDRQDLQKAKKDGKENVNLERLSKSHRKTRELRDDATEYQTPSDYDSARSKKYKLTAHPKNQPEPGIVTASEEPIKRRRLIAGRPPDRRRGSFMSTDSYSARDDPPKERVEMVSYDARRTKESSPFKRVRDSASPESKSRGTQLHRENSDIQVKKRKIHNESVPKEPPRDSTVKGSSTKEYTAKEPKRHLAKEHTPKDTAKKTEKDMPNEAGKEREEPSNKMSEEHSDPPTPPKPDSLAIMSLDKAASNDSMHQEFVAADASVQQTQQQNESPSAESSEPHSSQPVPPRGMNEDGENDIPESTGVDSSIVPMEEEPGRSEEATEAKETNDVKDAEDAAIEQTSSKELEEEQKRKELEEERIRHEEEERQKQLAIEQQRLARLREEQEAKEQEAKEQEAKEQRRRDALPERLRNCANLIGSNDPKATSLEWISKLRPLVTVVREKIDKSCDPAIKDELWIPNYYVAPLLASNDLQLSQYPNWEKRKATTNERFSLWKMGQSMLSGCADLPQSHSLDETFDLVRAARPKFFSMEHVFWVKLSDFMEIVPHSPHLNGFDFRLQRMAISIMPEALSDLRALIPKNEVDKPSSAADSSSINETKVDQSS